MPCMGPDMKGAREMGERIGEAMFSELVEKHHLFDVTDPKFDCMFKLPGAKRRWTRNRRLFIKIVGEVFSDDAANSF